MVGNVCIRIVADRKAETLNKKTKFENTKLTLNINQYRYYFYAVL